MKCRLCLIECLQESGVSLFHSGEESNLTKLIAKYLYIEITQLDAFSTVMCKECLQHLNEFHQFFQHVEEQQKVLQNEFLEIKCFYDERPLNPSTDVENVPQDLEHNDESMLDIKQFMTEDELCLKQSTSVDEFCYADDNIDGQSEGVFESDEEIPLQILLAKSKTKACSIEKVKKTTKNQNKSTKSVKSRIKRSYKLKTGKSKTKPNKLKTNAEDKGKEDDKSEKSKNYLTPQENKLRDEMVAKYVDLKCEMCGVRVDTYDNLKVHFRREHNRKAYITCCNTRFLRRFLLLDHIQSHLNPERFKCNLCNRVLKSQNNLNIHNRNMHADRQKLKHVCTLCNKRFQHLSGLNHHMFVHKEERDHICEVCEKGFKSNDLLKVHVDHMHGERDVFVCETCGKEYKFKLSFERHVAEHQGQVSDPTDKCPLCGKWYTLKNLKNHLKRHEVEECKCKECDKTFKSKSALAAHVSYAHTKRVFQCTYCEKTFKRPLALKEHIAMHTGRKDYNCPHCPREFRSKANMYAHIKKIHVEEWATTQMTRYQCPKGNVKEANT